MSHKDVDIVRELARKYREIAADERNEERRQRMSDTNDLKTGLRPAVLIDEVPWHEFASYPEMALVCEDPFLRGWKNISAASCSSGSISRWIWWRSLFIRWARVSPVPDWA